MPKQNSWIVFLHTYGGQGLSRSEISQKYQTRSRSQAVTKRSRSRAVTKRRAKPISRKAPGVCTTLKSVDKCGYNPNCTWVNKTGRCRGRSGTTNFGTVHQGPMGPPE